MRKDIDFNFTPHPLTGDLAIKTGQSAIDQAIRNLVLTDFYERCFNIEIGSNVRGSLFENDLPLLRQNLKDDITKVLSNFEPNAEIIDVEITSENPNELTVGVYYNMYNDATIRSVTIPMERLK